MVDRLALALFDQRKSPPDSGLRALQAALDDHFGNSNFGSSDATNHAAIMHPRRLRFTTIVTGVAASLVILGLALGMYGGERTTDSSRRTITRVADATAVLRTDLHEAQPPARIQQDFSALVRDLAVLRGSQRTDSTLIPTHLIASACRTMEQGLPPGTPVPSGCQSVVPTKNGQMHDTRSGPTVPTFKSVQPWTTGPGQPWTTGPGEVPSTHGLVAPSARQASVGTSQDAPLADGSEDGPPTFWSKGGPLEPSGGKSVPAWSDPVPSEGGSTAPDLGSAPPTQYQAPEQEPQQRGRPATSMWEPNGSSMQSNTGTNSSCGASVCGIPSIAGTSLAPTAVSH